MTSIPSDEYDGLPSTFAAACRTADQKQRRKPPDPTIERARRLLADEVTLERAWHEFNIPAGISASTLEAAEYLLRQKDPARLADWLDHHSAGTREAILRHLEQRKRMQPA